MSSYDNWNYLKGMLDGLVEKFPNTNGHKYYKAIAETMEKLEAPQKKEMRYVIAVCYLELYFVEPTPEEILKIAKEIPEDIRRQADQWDWNDTEVRDSVYVWMKNNRVERGG